MKHLIMAIALAATSVIATAGELSLQLHGLSWHDKERSEFDHSGRDWNERNVGLGIRNTYSETWSVQAGFYRNSVDKTTAYAAVNYTPIQFGAVRIGTFAGLVSGYRHPWAAGGMVELGPVTIRITPPINRPLTIGVEVGIPF